MFEMRRVIVAVEFGANSEAVVETAASLAAPFGATVEILHAYDPSTYGASDEMRLNLPSGARPTLGEYLSTQAERSMAELLEKTAESRRGVRVTTRVMRGDPRRVVPRRARVSGADLIVVGTAGRRGLSRFLMGSVAEHIARAAPCAVLVVPPRP